MMTSVFDRVALRATCPQLLTDKTYRHQDNINKFLKSKKK